jgi:hypothetical protein
MRYVFWAAVALLLFGVATGRAEARQVSSTCEGNIQNYTLSAYLEVGHNVDQPCVFLKNSIEGRKVLKVCPEGTACRIEGDFDNTATNYVLIRVRKVRKIHPEAD